MKLNRRKLEIAAVRAGMDFLELARETGLSTCVFYGTTKHTRIPTLIRICEALKCDVTDIVDDMEG